MMSPEPDLYPPDVDVVTKEMKSARDRAMAGTFLVTMGSGLMLERALDNNLDFFWLAVGFALIAGWLQAPRFMMFAVGAIMTGFATGGFFESLIDAPFESTISFLMAAAGFFAVYARYPHRARWALIPAGITAVLAVAATGVELIGFIPSAITSMLLPLLLIAGGALLLFRNALPRRAVMVGLAVIAVAFVGSAASTVDKWGDGDAWEFSPPFGMREVSAQLPNLEGKELVIETMNGEVELASLPAVVPNGGVVTARTRLGLHGSIEFEESGDEVRAVLRHGDRARPGDVNASWKIAVPRDTSVRISSTNGLVKGMLMGGDLEVDTTNGDVQLVVQGGAEGIDVETTNGDVQVTALVTALSLDLESSDGAIVVDGKEYDDSYEHSTDGPDVKVNTSNGSITVVGVAA